MSSALIVSPFWSVMIPVYNRVEFLREAIVSVLSQGMGPAEMQIGIIDDCSESVDVATLIRDWGFESRIEVFKTTHHLSIGAAWNACIHHARGHWVHILHSDDVVAPGYYMALQRGLSEHGNCTMAYCRGATIDESGRVIRFGILEQREPGVLLDDTVDKLIVDCRIYCPAVTVNRKSVSQFGGFREDLSYALDWEMWQRLSLRGPVWYEPSTLLFQRTHSNRETSQKELTEAWLNEIRQTIDIVLPQLSNKRRRLYNRAVARCGAYAIWRGFKYARARRWTDAFRSIRTSFSICIPTGVTEQPERCAARARMALDAMQLIPVRVSIGVNSKLRSIADHTPGRSTAASA